MKLLNNDLLSQISGGVCETPACQALQCEIAILQAKIDVLGVDYDEDGVAASLQDSCPEFAQMGLGDVKAYLKLLRRKHHLKQELDALRGWE